MLSISILAIGKIKGNDLEPLSILYTKRISWPLEFIELGTKKNLKGISLKEEEARLFEEYIHPKDYVIALDERGKNITSVQLSEKFAQFEMSSPGKIIFIIGGADGLAPQILERANFKISFGCQTWPHMLVRVMLLEQIYRAQQILIGHPYHRA
ncbi:MAG: 23S rRNA (pseudouridine(1915)-N(3))-methyltransferase RlmH [Alphaproteobacteria bacterium]|nr:23S rRNA (pseudouridine(1915)-N(3))-methyltransferase RlmH [Alphaproteobacteria bacterium]